MADVDPARQEILLRLAQSRAELRQIFEPPSQNEPGSAEAGAGASGGGHGMFPRSRTMRLLTSGRPCRLRNFSSCSLHIQSVPRVEIQQFIGAERSGFLDR